jgi:hypothetical protein
MKNPKKNPMVGLFVLSHRLHVDDGVIMLLPPIDIVAVEMWIETVELTDSRRENGHVPDVR